MDEEMEKPSGIDPMTGNFIEAETAGTQPENKTVDNKERLQKAEEFMQPDDFEVFKKCIEQKNEVESSALFDLHGKALHTTNSYYFEKILHDGTLQTGTKADGLYRTSGASFTDGDSEVAAVFQTIIDDQNSRSGEKRLNSEKYFSKTRELVAHFWEENEAATREYLERISGNHVTTLTEAVAAAEKFKYKTTPKEIENNPQELEKVFGVTLVFDKEKLPELSTEGTEGLQKKFELRSYRPEGVSIADASTVFVPEGQILAIRQKLQKQGLQHITVRSSEELEAIRLAKVLDRK